VFLADVKGDLTGIAQAGTLPPRVAALMKERGLPEPESRACPVTLWDVFGEQGHPVRAHGQRSGPLLLARMLALNETQVGRARSRVQGRRRRRPPAARPEGPARDAPARRRQRAASSPPSYGNVSAASIGAIQRGLLQLEQQGGANSSASRCSRSTTSSRPSTARRVNVLAADKLLQAPRVYAAFLLWLLRSCSRLAGSRRPEKPVIAFFFDEAHLLFEDAPPRSSSGSSSWCASCAARASACIS
jgi:DNA helicase HerA-like ATPase